MASEGARNERHRGWAHLGHITDLTRFGGLVKFTIPGFIAAAVASIALPAFANPVVEGANRVVPGTYDPITKTIRPLTLPVSSALTPEAAGPTFTGKFVTKFTINVASAFPTNYPIECDVEATGFDGLSTSTPAFYFEAAATTATRVSATSATCTVTIPYSWPNIRTAASDTVALSYFIIATTAPTSAGIANFVRESSQAIGTIKLPASGTTTTETVNATI